MTPNPIENACRLLREGAAELKNCHTLAATGHDWTGEPEAKAAYDEHTAAADALESLHAECEALRTGYAAARLEIESLRARSVEPAGEYPLPGRTTDELMESQRKSAIAAYRAAHGHDPDFGFAPDRSWIEGAAYVDADRAMRAAQPAHPDVSGYVSEWSGGLCTSDEAMDGIAKLYAAQAAPAAVAPDGDYDALRCAVGNCTFNGDVTQHAATCPNKPAAQAAHQQEPTCKENLQVQVWVIPNGAGSGQFSWEPQDERYWTKLTTQPAPQQEPGNAVYQFRKQHCADWYDGRADHTDGRGPYEERTLYTSPQQEAQEPVAWYVTGCGRLLDEYEAEDEARRIGGTAKAMPLYTAPQPSHASQGDALDAEQHEIDARHAAIYRWMLSHVADVLSIFDNWFADEEADTDELHDALAARAAQEGK